MKKISEKIKTSKPKKLKKANKKTIFDVFKQKLKK
jgi:hypothetical protein